MEKFEVTHEEKLLILKRRELFSKRQKRGVVHAKDRNVSEQKPQKQVPKNSAHRGRITDPKHEMHWFEKEIFAKISNLEHAAEHKKISTILNMPIQHSSRDRVYHSLCHLDVLWTEERLPLHYKRKYEEFKKKYGIGETNLYPDIVKDYPKENCPEVKNKRPWNPELYKDIESKEKFDPKKSYIYKPKAA